LNAVFEAIGLVAPSRKEPADAEVEVAPAGPPPDAGEQSVVVSEVGVQRVGLDPNRGAIRVPESEGRRQVGRRRGASAGVGKLCARVGRTCGARGARRRTRGASRRDILVLLSNLAGHRAG
jgi:hypothetical protein